MSTTVYAFLEIFDDDGWRFAGNFVEDEAYDFELVPENIAPASWGKFNFAVYYNASGEKGLPPDASPSLRQFIGRCWPSQNRPSWMTIAEMRAFYESDQDHRYAHFDFERLASAFDLPEAHIRVVFWAEQ